MYSGITSTNADESNLGFVLVNMRTHEAMKIKIAGANEISAMKCAEAEVKTMGIHPLIKDREGNLYKCKLTSEVEDTLIF